MTVSMITLGFGYVESSATSLLIFAPTEKTPKTKKEAFLSLTEYLYQKYVVETNYLRPKIKECCEPFLNKEAYCPKCGCKLETFEFIWSTWKSYLIDLLHSTADSYGEHYCVDNPYGWNPWEYNLSKCKNALNITEKAEEMLSFALEELHPELRLNNEYDHARNRDLDIEKYKELLK